MKMNIAIDCRSLTKKPAGVPNFLIAFINELSIQIPNGKVYLLSNQLFHTQVNERLRPQANVITIIETSVLFKKIAIVWYLVKMPFVIRKLDIDFFYTPIPNLPIWLPKKIITCITVHDMVYKRFAYTMSIYNKLINFFLHDRSINQADRIWAISNYTQSEVINLYPNRKRKSIFVGSSIDKGVYRTKVISPEKCSKLIKKFNLGDKLLLFVGTMEPRKNITFLLSLMPELMQHGFSLLIVGKEGWGKIDKNVINEKGFPKDKIGFSGFIDFEELVDLYHVANLYVSTSLNEGFGLPQLEAMSCGCPVVCPHNSAMIEVVEGAGETVQGWDKEKWINTILKVSGNRPYYISNGLKRASHYNWKIVCDGLIKYLISP
jgi:glycosyltransferase involved in cell wall biosynthesis